MKDVPNMIAGASHRRGLLACHWCALCSAESVAIDRGWLCCDSRCEGMGPEGLVAKKNAQFSCSVLTVWAVFPLMLSRHETLRCKFPSFEQVLILGDPLNASIVPYKVELNGGGELVLSFDRMVPLVNYALENYAHRIFDQFRICVFLGGRPRLHYFLAIKTLPATIQRFVSD